jgi:hypothetical protein
LVRVRYGPLDGGAATGSPLGAAARAQLGAHRVAVQEDGGKWLFYGADAYFYRGEIGGEHYACTPGLRGYQRLMQVDAAARLTNLERLRRLDVEHRDEIRIFCAHDVVEYELLAGRSHQTMLSKGLA